MTFLATLQSEHGVRTSIEYEFNRDVRSLASDGLVDAFIVSTEGGFSPLGQSIAFLSADLGIPEREIDLLATWNHSENPRVTLVALKSRNVGGSLRGVVLAPSENSQCYRSYSQSHTTIPNRDFYYNVTYEAIAFAHENWGARRLSLSHLSGSGSFHEDVATCNAEALAHFCDSAPNAQVESFMFVGCCISTEHLKGITRLNAEATTGRHVPIVIELEHCVGYDLVHLDWGLRPRCITPVAA